MKGLFRKMKGLEPGARVELKLLSDRFETHRALFEAPHAVAFDALDKTTGTRVFLWRMKAAVPVQLAEKMLENMLLPILRSGVPAPAIVCFGVAQEGILFYASEQNPSPSVLDKEVQNRWKGLYVARMARFMAYLHSQGVTLGCLHHASFLANRDDSLLFNGLFPVVASQLKRDELRGSTLEFAAPELRLGKPLNAASDVFSLGAYLYHFISGHEFPSHLDEQQLYQHLRVQMPLLCSPENGLLWLKPILEKMLQWKPERRYPNGEALFQALSQDCPEMGIFGAGMLKSIDNAAASYVLSPFSRGAVAAITVALLFAVALERLPENDAQLTATHSTQPKTIGIDSGPQEVARVDIGSLSQLTGAETEALPIKKTVSLSETFRNAMRSNEHIKPPEGVFYDLDAVEKRAAAVEQKMPDISENAAMPDHPYVSPVAIQRKTFPTRPSEPKRPSVEDSRWLIEGDSALLSVLVHGRVSQLEKRPWCSLERD